MCHTRHVNLNLGIAFLAAAVGLTAATVRPALNFQKAFGGSGSDSATAVTVDRDGNTYVAGTTTSIDFPVKNAFQPRIGGAPLRFSANGGITWSAPDVPNAVYAVAGSPKKPNVVYAATHDRVLKSMDSGLTWAVLPYAEFRYIEALVVDAGNPDVVYAGAFSGVHKSDDGGMTWRLLDTTQNVIVLVASPARPSTLFSAVAINGPQTAAVYRTTDAGANWSLLADSPAGTFSLACDPGHPDILYAAASTRGYFSNSGTQAVYKSVDAGDNWSKVAELPMPVSTFGLAANSSAVYAGTNDGVFLSRDGGLTWSGTSVTSLTDNIAIDPYNPRIVYASADRIQRSTDGGVTWTRSLEVRQDVQVLTIVPTNPPSVFMGATPGQNIFITKWTPDGKQMLYSTYLGGSFYDFATGIAVDSQGNAYLSGYAYSLDFPTTVGAPQRRNLGSANAFVAKIGPDGSRLAFSTYLGGGKGDAASAIAVDSSGNAFVTGYAGSSDFPVTASAAQSKLREKCGLLDSFGYPKFDRGDAFVAKIDTVSGKVGYATFLGGTCGEQGFGITVDPGGNALVAGATDSPDFPVTGGALQASFTGDGSSGFLARLTPQGSLSYATFLGLPGNDSASAVAVDAQGNIYLTGSTSEFGLGGRLAFFGTIDLAHEFSIGFPAFRSGAAYVLKLDPTGSQRVYVKYVGTNYLNGQSIAIDPIGRIWIAGSALPYLTTDPPFPSTHPLQAKIGQGFVTQLSPDGQTILFASALNGASGLALDSSGNAFIAGSTTDSDVYKYFNSNGLLTRIDVDVPSAMTVEEPQRLIPSTGTNYPYDGVVPGEFLILNGSGLGPDQEVAQQLTPEGKVATMLAGTSVTFNGIPAPLISVQGERIVCVAPFGVDRSQVALMRVERNGDQANSIRVGVQWSAVGVSAVLNSDGSANSSGRPAVPGSLITLYAVGLGQTNPPGVDGEIAVHGTRKFDRGPFRASIDGTDVDITYIGGAPGQISAVTQVDVRVPAGLAAGSHNLEVGFGESRFYDSAMLTIGVGSNNP